LAAITAAYQVNADAPARRLVERRAQHAAPAEEDDEVVARDGGGKHEGERHEHVDGSPAPEAPAREEVCRGMPIAALSVVATMDTLMESQIAERCSELTGLLTGAGS
jgi:hypothetical protein